MVFFKTSGALIAQHFVISGSYDPSSMLHDRITSNFSIGRRLHQTLQPVSLTYEPMNGCRNYFYSEYPFAKYNIQPTTYTYSQDEYTRFLEGEIILTRVPIFYFYSLTDKEWTKEETDYLFSVVRDFDLRWYIIHDRYEYPQAPSRTLEVLHLLPYLSDSAHMYYSGPQRSLLQRLSQTGAKSCLDRR
jgi:hypothetical protein